MSYINSTGGILPANYIQRDTITRMSSYAYLPANTKLERNINPPNGFSRGYTMLQQGFTSDVSCQERELNTTTSPSLELLHEAQTVFNRTIALVALKVLCSGATDYITTDFLQTPSTVDAVLGAECNLVLPDGTMTYEVIIMGVGLYSYTNTVVCSIVPRVTSLQVDHSDAISF